MKKQWYEKQLRIFQTVLREPDVVDYDANSVVAYLEKIHANCIVVNAGGIVDFFRHDLQTANPNPFMTDEDLLKDLTEACHAKGIKVIVRVDFRGVDKRIYDLYPDWFAADENGDPIFWANAPTIPNPLYAPCYLSYYRNEHTHRFMELLLERYEIDGIWENSFAQEEICYCKTCKAQYKEDLNKELPQGEDFLSPIYDEYRAWKASNVEKHLDYCHKLVKKHGEDKIYCAEIFGLFYDQYKSKGHDLFNIKDHFDFLMTLLYTGNQHPLSAPATLIKFLKSLSPEKTPVLHFGHLGTNNELRYVASNPEETRIWMWETISAGGSLWNCIFVGQHGEQTFDQRNALISKDVFNYMETHEEKLDNQFPVSEATIFYSRDSNNLLGKGDRSKDHYVTNLMGMEQVLLDHHIQYNILTDNDFSLDKLKNTKLLAMPNAATLSDEKAEVIREYVRNGGHLIATYQTSLFDENGTERNDLALGDVFGCSYTGITKDCSHYGYQCIRQTHPITKGFEQTKLIANWGNNLLVRILPDSNATAPITYVPQIYPQSPERAWLRSLETEFPTAVVNQYGKGTVIYLPYEVDRNVWMHGHRDFSDVLINSFNLLMDKERVVQTNAPASVHISLNTDSNRPNCYMLHAVNISSTPRRPISELLPVHNINIELCLPIKSLKHFEVLRSDSNIELIKTEEAADQHTKLHFHISEIKEYMGIWIETEI